MARFQLSADARKYFKHIISSTELFSDLFDPYYFCLIAGFTSGKTAELPGTELTDYFIDNYKPAKNFLIGMLIISELKKGGIGLSEKDAVQKKIRYLIDPNSPNHLTDEGMKRMNAYANGGYEFLNEKRPGGLWSAEEFLEDFVSLIDQANNDSL